MILSPIRFALTDEQKLKLKPFFDAVTEAHNKSTDKCNLRHAIHGQVFEADGGYAEFRLLDHEQTEIIRTAILKAIEIDKRKEMQSRLVQIKSQLAALAKEQTEINVKLRDTKPGATKETRNPGRAPRR